MMERERLDAVSICIAPRAREPLLRYAAENGIPMLVEKPWAANLDHAERLAAICRQHDALVMPAFSFRFHPAVVRAARTGRRRAGQRAAAQRRISFSLGCARGKLAVGRRERRWLLQRKFLPPLRTSSATCWATRSPSSPKPATRSTAPGDNAAAVTLRFASGASAALTLGGIGTGAFRDFPRLDLVTAHGQARLRGREHVWEELELGHARRATCHAADLCARRKGWVARATRMRLSTFSRACAAANRRRPRLWTASAASP